MSLLEEFSQEFIRLDKKSVPDGQGGSITKYEDGMSFKMPQAHDTTIEAQIAEQQGTASTYTFLPSKDMKFEYHDVFKRVSDGQVFRVTNPSSEDYTPNMSKLNITKIKAEKWELTE